MNKARIALYSLAVFVGLATLGAHAVMVVLERAAYDERMQGMAVPHRGQRAPKFFPEVSRQGDSNETHPKCN